MGYSGALSFSLTILAIRLTTAASAMGVALLSLAILLGTGVPSQEIAFTSSRSGDSEIYVMDTQRGFVANLSHDPNYDFNPAWSPDGAHVAFESARDGDFGIWIMDASGNNSRRLIPGRGGSPAWSPDGERIAFSSERDGNYEIYIADVRCDILDCDSTIRRLTFDKANDFNPAWSPDGARVIFQSDRGQNRYRAAIYSMDTAGDNLQLLSGKDSIAVDPAWSPDGRWLVFMSTQSGGKNLHVLDMQGNVVQPIQAAPGNYDGSPSWSADGTRIAFDSDRFRNGYRYGWGIYAVNAACIADPQQCDVQFLTEGIRPAWRPSL
jgi:Tol biopolymer transport system component